MPSLPGVRPKSSVRAFHERDGRVSAAAVFTASPRLTGADQGAPTQPRVATQTSWPPRVPGRFVEQDVGWLHVPMYEAARMGRIQRARHLREDADRIRRVQPAPFEALFQVTPLAVAHRVKRRSSAVPAS
jgi:hypothetical protein